MNAQNIIRGKITDKNGLPIPGAKVSVTGDTGTALSEFDGTFHLITDSPVKRVLVDYVGYNSKSVKASDNELDITMTKTNVWNRKPSKPIWLVSIQSAFPENLEQPSFGIMLGCVKYFGGYVKVLEGFMPGETCSRDNLTMTLKSPFFSVTGGFLVRLGSALHFNLGGGYARRRVTLATETTLDTEKNSQTLLEKYSYSGAAIDCGLTLLLGRVNLSAGAIFPVGVLPSRFIGNFGVGVNF